MVKVCFFVNSMFQLGGEQRITTKVVNGLIQEGYDVTILIKYKEDVQLDLFGLSAKAHLVFLDVCYPFRLNNTVFFEKLRILNRKTGLFRRFPRLIRHFFCSNLMLQQLSFFFSSRKFDFVIGVAGDRSFILSFLKPIISGKLIFWNHQSVDAHFKTKNSRYYREEAFIEPLLKRFDEIVVLTYEDQKRFYSLYHLLPTVIPNCLSFHTLEKSSLQHKKFLAVGRLVYQKGFDYLLEAMHIFSKFNSTWTLDIYGEGEEYASLQKLLEKYDLVDRVKFYKREKDMIKVYLEHDVYLMSSRYEGFGLVTLEAMECGLPVIGFSIPATEEIVSHQINGILVPCYDVLQFAEAMKNITESSSLLKKLASNLESSTKKFSEEEIFPKWFQLLKK